MTEPHSAPQRPTLDQTREQAIARMNAGYARSAQGRAEDLAAAIELYSEAIELLAALPKDASNANAIAAAYMNRGQLRHQLHGTAQSQEALSDFEFARSALEPLMSQATPWARRNFVGTLVNHANMLLDLDRSANAQALAQQALAALPSNADDLADPTDLTLQLYAARALCDAIGHRLPETPPEAQAALAEEALDHVRAGLDRIEAQRRHRGDCAFRNVEVELRLYRFGTRLLAQCEPENLADFVEAYGKCPSEPDFRDATREALRIAADTVSRRFLERDTSLEQQDALRQLAESFLRIDTELAARIVAEHG